jgi:hypothetical protein
LCPDECYSVYSDIDETGAKITAFLPFAMLLVPLLTALGFEFVNGFHDTANAVVTVIYTHSLRSSRSCRSAVAQASPWYSLC